MTKASIIPLVAAMAAPLCAQFGGRDGDVVLFVLSHRGPFGFQSVAPGSTNTAATTAQFRVTDTLSLTPEIVLPDFPERTAQTPFRAQDDQFQMITQIEYEPTVRAEFTAKGKEFTLRGILRDDNLGGKEKIDFIAGGFAPFTPGVTVGPDVGINEVAVILWRHDISGPPFRAVPNSYVGPAVPPGLTGPEFSLSLGKVPLFIPWRETRTVYPNQNWPQGVDIKEVEHDREIPTYIQLMRIRPGRRTPLFRIQARTHFFVLQGAVDIASAGGAPARMTRDFHAYVPTGHIIQLSNARAFAGPLGAQSQEAQQ
jgi:hypothetical protein